MEMDAAMADNDADVVQCTNPDFRRQKNIIANRETCSARLPKTTLIPMNIREMRGQFDGLSLFSLGIDMFSVNVFLLQLSFLQEVQDLQSIVQLKEKNTKCKNVVGPRSIA